MREIKFRAWDNEEAYMFTVDTIPFPIGGIYVYGPGVGGGWAKVNGVHHKETIILEQFTGLHDKNGKEIYEGDICKIWFDVSKVEDHIYNSLTKEEQETEERIFIVESPLFNNQQELNADQIEVIGNIHEATK